LDQEIASIGVIDAYPHPDPSKVSCDLVDGSEVQECVMDVLNKRPREDLFSAAVPDSPLEDALAKAEWSRTARPLLVTPNNPGVSPTLSAAIQPIRVRSGLIVDFPVA
jgi:hypothetical protein